MHPSMGAPPLPVALAELEDLMVTALDAMVVIEEVVRAASDAVVGMKGVSNSVVAVTDVSGTVVTVTLTTVRPVGAGLGFAAKGSGGAQIPGAGVSQPESWMLVVVTVTLDTVVVKVPTITPLGTS